MFNYKYLMIIFFAYTLGCASSVRAAQAFNLRHILACASSVCFILRSTFAQPSLNLRSTFAQPSVRRFLDFEF